jgi:hypothetical protein
MSPLRNRGRHRSRTAPWSSRWQARVDALMSELAATVRDLAEARRQHAEGCDCAARLDGAQAYIAELESAARKARRLAAAEAGERFTPPTGRL